MTLALVAGLSTQRQSLLDWSRFRTGKLSWDLILGQKSPANTAIAINLAISAAILLPVIMVLPLGTYKEPLIWGVILHSTMILLYCAIVQLLLLIPMKTNTILAAAAIGLMTIVPPIVLGILNLDPDRLAAPWLFSVLPAVATEYAPLPLLFTAVIGESLGVIMLNLELHRRLRVYGQSEFKTLVSSSH
ncbi:MAG: hypothetical protein HC796_04810 [Synechococcaceae cyanobacterium RL_1_2]|nr:hypothetical protein [Synechococcaceae cyanobacterium RL_1_2]